MGGQIEADRGVEDKAGDAKALVTVEGLGMSISREVTEEQVAAILAVILRPAGAAGRRPEMIRESDSGPAGEESLGEFFRRVGPRRNPDKIVTIAEYMKGAEGTKLFAPEEILGRFKEVGEPAPGNFGRDLKWARRIAWIALDPQSGQYYVTASGSKAVTNGFPEEVTRSTKIKTRRDRPSRSDVPSSH